MSADNDEYEAAYMRDGELVHRTKSKAPWWFGALFIAPAVLIELLMLVLVGMGKARPTVLVAIVPLLLVNLPLWVLFAVLRATITSKYLHIQYGLFGPKIPLARVQSCVSVTYDWKEYGYGFRRGKDGSLAYNMAGDQGLAVKVRYLDDRGREKVVLLSAPDPDGFVAALNQARGVRVAPVRASIAASTVETRASDPVIDSAFEELDEEAAKKRA